MKNSIMGIVNVTPDSFYDGGRHATTEKAIQHGLKLVREGADILDIGGESTRPGSLPVPQDVELQRVIPVIEGISRETEVAISIDTTKSIVAKKALEAGATIINDISGMTFDDAMLSVGASGNADIILMHTLGRPEDMQKKLLSEHIIDHVLEFLTERIKAAEEAGISRDRIIVDPGIGFGKSVEQNYLLLNNIDKLLETGCRVLIGLSRKSLIGNIQAEGTDRLPATITLNMFAFQQGAHIIRVHDVAEHWFARNALNKLQSCTME